MEGEGYRREEGEELELLPGPGEVVVLDSATCVREEGRRGEGGEGEKIEEDEVGEERSEDKVSDDNKESDVGDVGHLLAALSYWCQGKPLGCFLEPQVTRCRHVRVTWHPEEDYNSRYYTLMLDYITIPDTAQS